MARSRLVLLACLASVAGFAEAQDDEPDLSFLEYLGSWDESDEEWIVVADMEDDELEDELEDELKDEDEASGKDEETDEQEET